MSASRVVRFSAVTESVLSAAVDGHNGRCSAGRAASLEMLSAVYRRGAASRPAGSLLSRHELGMMRVGAFLSLLRSGAPENPAYRVDNDLLPVSHPRSTRGVAAAAVDDYAEELAVSLLGEDGYASTEDAIFALTEFSGLGYEAEPAVRAAWIRAVNSGQSPYQRALSVAEYTYDSSDADLLPRPEKGAVSE